MEEDELTLALESLKLKESKLETGRFGESYVVDESTGTRYVFPTKRPDGTLRKEIKIRPGYVPPEERQVYIPVHRRTEIKSNENKCPENGPGSSEKNTLHNESTTADNRLTNTGSGGDKSQSKFSNESKSRSRVGRNRANKATHSCVSNEGGEPPQSDPAPVEVDPKTLENEISKDREIRVDDKKLKNGINNTLRKIKEIKLLQEKLNTGMTLNPNQVQKLNRLPELEQKLKELKLLDRWDLK